MADEEGANPNEQLLFACRTDNVELLQSLLSSSSSSLDINHVDGLGNTALHYAAQHASTAVLPELLEEEVDVDLQNRIAGDTPLHVAVAIEDEETRNWVVNQLLESGADPRIANKQDDKPVDLIVNASSALGTELKDMLRKAEATAGFSADDVADDDDDDGAPQLGDRGRGKEKKMLTLPVARRRGRRLGGDAIGRVKGGGQGLDEESIDFRQPASIGRGL